MKRLGRKKDNMWENKPKNWQENFKGKIAKLIFIRTTQRERERQIEKNFNLWTPTSLKLLPPEVKHKQHQSNQY